MKSRVLLFAFCSFLLSGCKEEGGKGPVEPIADKVDGAKTGEHYEAMVSHRNDFQKYREIIESGWTVSPDGEPEKVENNLPYGMLLIREYDKFQEAATAVIKAGGDPAVISTFDLSGIPLWAEKLREKK